MFHHGYELVSHLSHSFLLIRENPLLSTAYECYLTIKHILLNVSILLNQEIDILL